MTRRLNRCRRCAPVKPSAQNPFAMPRGWTRHDDQVCARCRPDAAGGVYLLPYDFDPTAPSRADLNAAVRLPVRMGRFA